jgi:serine protease
MKKFLLLCLFVIGLGFALFNFKGLANQGEFGSIVLDFREDIPATEISAEVDANRAKIWCDTATQ